MGSAVLNFVVYVSAFFETVKQYHLPGVYDSVVLHDI